MLSLPGANRNHAVTLLWEGFPAKGRSGGRDVTQINVAPKGLKKIEVRNDVVDVLFDQLITFPLDSLKAATKAIHDAEAALAKKDNPQGRALVKEARDLIAAMPVTAAQAESREVAGAFTGAKEKGARQAELEQQWAGFAKERYAQARAKAEEAMKLAR